MKKENKHYIDLSDIKEAELSKTASFTDLMSRTEKKEHERLKEEEKTRELKEILMNDDDKKELKKEEKRRLIEERKRKKQEQKINKQENDEDNSKDINKTENLGRTQRFLDLTKEIKVSMLNNVDENIQNKKREKLGIGNIIITDILIIISLAYYIYSILFTNVQTSQLYLLIGGLIILAMIMFFCISVISTRLLSKIFSILNYILFIGYILFNLILVLGIITL